MSQYSDLKLEPRLFINNKFVDAKSGKTLPVINPTDDTHIGDIQVAGEQDIDDAVAAAEAALKGEWGSYTGAQRAKCILKLADLLEAKGAEISKIESLSMGTPISILSYGLLPGSVSTLRYAAGWADKIPGESFKDDPAGYYSIVEHVPFGVCAAISPWNATPLYIAHVVGYACAGGNVVVYKASELAPFSALTIAGLIEEAGFPPGVVNFVSGAGETGALLASHMKIRLVNFTGSAPTGHKVMELAAKSNLKKVILELGGNAPAIVFDDANLENAIESTAGGALRLTGQTCICPTRIIVHRSISEKFVKAAKDLFEKTAENIGTSPLDPSNMVGPLANLTNMKIVLNGIERSKEGATLLVGGERKGDVGQFITPAIFVDAQPAAYIWKHEIFGPVIVVKTFETEEEAIDLANDTAYGLAATVFTTNGARALRVSRKLEAGIITVNGFPTTGQNGPFGGMKGSGLGRVGGNYGIMGYLETKSIAINMAQTVWGQCGGIDWSGPTACESGAYCVVRNLGFSQCIPDLLKRTTETIRLTTPPPLPSPSPTSSLSTPSKTLFKTPSSASASSASKSYRYLISFGDNYTATGFSITRSKPSSSNPLGNPTFPGETTSGGANWIGHLVSKYNHTLTYSYNLAVHGATVDNSLVGSLANVPSLVDQVAVFSHYLTPTPAYAPWTSSNSLFAIWIGSNDVENGYTKSDWNSVAQSVIRRYFQEVQILYDAGARNFVFLTVPPISKTPFARSRGTEAAQREAAAVLQYNQLLAQALVSFRRGNRDVNAKLFDTAGVFNHAIASPDTYGAQDATCVNEYGNTCLWYSSQNPGVAIQDLVAQGVAGSIGF
ncbi:aldehyde dehydrogenase family-domain-containing protein [Xylogone sp. PMI_703]|nr:aldehyde dehydrogenase family-domain-containing protein [Xylogone sp. PMI_703]